MADQLTVRAVEQWALRVVEAFMRGAVEEDARVEFKRELPPEVQRVARRLAGHANAARGEPILWVLGVDEAHRALVPGGLPQDAADYWPQIWAKFEGPHPELVDVYIDFNGGQLLALGFRCDLVPYVVKTERDTPRFEVPWREGTRIDTATRSQLIRMMQPVVRAPSVEVRHVVSSPESIAVIFFVAPATTELVSLPVHRALLQRGESTIVAHEVTGNNTTLVQPHPILKEAKDQAVYFYGPAEVVAKWRLGTSQPPERCRARLTFEPGRIEVVVSEGIPPR